jgi:hypothetical protein
MLPWTFSLSSLLALAAVASAFKLDAVDELAGLHGRTLQAEAGASCDAGLSCDEECHASCDRSGRLSCDSTSQAACRTSCDYEDASFCDSCGGACSGTLEACNDFGQDADRWNECCGCDEGCPTSGITQMRPFECPVTREWYMHNSPAGAGDRPDPLKDWYWAIILGSLAAFSCVFSQLPDFWRKVACCGHDPMPPARQVVRQASKRILKRPGGPRPGGPRRNPGRGSAL